MADTLLFRKGPLSGLTNLPIKNGAISITTDEPGIYIDHNGKRSRVGDFITVAKMSDLSQYKLNPANEEDRYNAHALYYVIENDALARWDATAKDFKLINDRTTLVNSLAALSTALTSLTGVVEGHGTSITANATAIETEKSRAETAEKALDDKIKAITSGTDGTTLASLKAAIEAEEDRAMAAEAANAAAAKKAQDEVDALEGVVAELSEDLQEEITRATNKENELAGKIGVNTEGSETGLYQLIKEEKARAMGVEAGLESKITTAKSELNTAITNETNRATAAENKIATFTGDEVTGGALHDEITRAKNREDAIEDIAEEARGKANTNATDIAGLKTADTTLTNRIKAEEDRAKAAEEALDDRIDAVVEEAKTHALKTEVQAVAGDLGALTTRVGTAEGDIQNITQQITLLDKAIDDEIEDRAEAITEVKGLISAETSARETAISDEVTARNTAIETAVNAAKSTLNESIASNLQKINANTKAITDEETRAKAAEKTNSDAITQLGKDLAAEASRADTAEKANAKAIADEVTARANADTQLQTNITNLDTRLSGAISSEATTRASEDTRILSEAKEYADGLLEASTAMHYKGEVSVKADLPTVNVDSGDTYVVADPGFTLVSGESYKVGDLLVAKNDSVSGTAYPASGWSHVKTGYDASLDQSLTVSAATNGATAALSSVAGSGNKGSLTIVGNTNSNVKASLDGSTLTINMEWEEWT